MTTLVFKLVDVRFANQKASAVCAAVTECMLVPVKAALSAENCSGLVRDVEFRDIDEFVLESVHVRVSGVNLNRGFVYAPDMRECCARVLGSFLGADGRVALIDVDTGERVEAAFEAMLVIACFALLALFLNQHVARGRRRVSL